MNLIDEPDIQFPTSQLYENGELRQHDTSAASIDAVSQSFANIRNNSYRMSNIRQYDPKKFKDVKSKVGRNVKV